VAYGIRAWVETGVLYLMHMRRVVECGLRQRSETGSASSLPVASIRLKQRSVCGWHLAVLTFIAKARSVSGSSSRVLGAYFALSVTAAGWHSGALMLVNEDLAARVTVACERRDPLAPVEEDTAEEHADNSAPESSNDGSLSSSIISTALDYGRWFLGVAPYNVTPPVQQQPRNATTGRLADPNRLVGHPNTRVEQIHAPRNYGDSPREGFKYVWAFDHFPRLRLSNGVEMPGEVEFDEWRYERPTFDVHAGL
jgi:SCF-associated factor 1